MNDSRILVFQSPFNSLCHGAQKVGMGVLLKCFHAKRTTEGHHFIFVLDMGKASSTSHRFFTNNAGVLFDIRAYEIFESHKRLVFLQNGKRIQVFGCVCLLLRMDSDSIYPTSREFSRRVWWRNKRQTHPHTCCKYESWPFPSRWIWW